MLEISESAKETCKAPSVSFACNKSRRITPGYNYSGSMDERDAYAQKLRRFNSPDTLRDAARRQAILRGIISYMHTVFGCKYILCQSFDIATC